MDRNSTLPKPALLSWITGMVLTVFLLCAPQARAEISPEDAQSFINGLAQQAVSHVGDKQISDDERKERFRKLFVSSFDLPGISKFVLARYWRSATPEQQQTFVKLFEEFQVLNWAHVFKEYTGVTLAVMGATKDEDNGFSVQTELRRSAGNPTAIQWRVHPGADGHLQVIDIMVEGVSMAITQRSDYNAMLQANGGKFDGLLDALRTKIAQMAAKG